MKKFEGILICSDLDGTLLNSNKEISKENLDAIEYFKANGGLFTFITGRMPSYVSDIYNKVNPNAPFGCVNGGGIYDHKKGEYLYTNPIDKSVLELVEYIDKSLPEMGIQVSAYEKVYFCKNNAAMVEFRKETGLPNLEKNYREISEPMAKILFADLNTENIDKLSLMLQNHSRANEFDFIRSDKTLYEILPKGIDKGAVLPILAELIDIDINKTIAIGDYNNDLGMIKTAKIGVAVENAIDELKSVADYVTVSNDNHAIAQVIYDLDSGKFKI